MQGTFRAGPSNILKPRITNWPKKKLLKFIIGKKRTSSPHQGVKLVPVLYGWTQNGHWPCVGCRLPPTTTSCGSLERILTPRLVEFSEGFLAGKLECQRQLACNASKCSKLSARTLTFDVFTISARGWHIGRSISVAIFTLQKWLVHKFRKAGGWTVQHL